MDNAEVQARPRLHFVDLMRGWIVCFMALDHVSYFHNAARFSGEFYYKHPAPPASLPQFLLRFIMTYVTPGFWFIAGFMAAVAQSRRARAGEPAAKARRHLIVRGLALIGIEMVYMPLLFGHYVFDALSSIGACLVLTSLVLSWPSAALLSLALGVLVLHPLIPAAPDAGFSAYLMRVLHETRPQGNFISFYPLLPWWGVFLAGYLCGRGFESDPDAAKSWVKWGAACGAIFLIVRLIGKYGNAYPYERVLSYDFWIWSKYPPDLAWLAWGFMCIFFLMAFFLRFQDSRALRSLPARVIADFGRVSLFFFVAHFAVLTVVAFHILPKGFRAFGIPGLLAYWALLLLALWWPCRAYWNFKSARGGTFWAYL